MQNCEPVLAEVTLLAGPERYYPCVFRVHGGLDYLRGNTLPHFSLTYVSHRVGRPLLDCSCGAGHEEILRHFPQFADLAGMHLSDIYGVPMHAEASGWYMLAGALGGQGEQYHYGNAKQSFPLPANRIPADKPWLSTEYRHPTAEECLSAFARHCRIGVTEARQLADEVRALPFERRRPRWGAECEQMRPRWRREALTCVQKHGLRLFGDPWAAEIPSDFRAAGLRRFEG